MKFTSEQLSKVMGLKIGDKVNYSGGYFQLNENYKLINEVLHLDLSFLVDKEFEIIGNIHEKFRAMEVKQ